MRTGLHVWGLVSDMDAKKKTVYELAGVAGLRVIRLTIGGHPAYLAKPGAEWDGSWFTRKVANARLYRTLSGPRRIITEYDRSCEPWASAEVESAEQALDRETDVKPVCKHCGMPAKLHVVGFCMPGLR